MKVGVMTEKDKHAGDGVTAGSLNPLYKANCEWWIHYYDDKLCEKKSFYTKFIIQIRITDRDRRRARG